MDSPSISQDDLIDVAEMTDKIEAYIHKVLKGHDSTIAISALMSASINCLIAQSETLDEIVLYRDIFFHMLDNSIRHIRIKKPTKPSSS